MYVIAVDCESLSLQSFDSLNYFATLKFRENFLPNYEKKLILWN